MTIVSFPTFSVDPFTYTATYSAVNLTWTPPTGGNTLVLVRNLFNAPANQIDGTVILTQPISAPGLFTDNPVLPVGGGFVYYTIFVSAGTNWWRGGDVQATMAGNWGYAADLWNHIPGWYRSLDGEQSLQTAGDLTWQSFASSTWVALPPETWSKMAEEFAAPPAEGPLQRFLALLGTELDRARTLIEQMANLNNPALVAGNLLPLLAQELGVGIEDALGMAQMRVLVGAVIHLYRTKGTLIGIEDVVSAITGWASNVVIGPNLVLLPDEVAVLTTPTTEIISGLVGFGNGFPIMPAAYTGNFGPLSWPGDLSSTVTTIPAQAWFAASGLALSDQTTLTWSTDRGSLVSGTPVANPVGWGIPLVEASLVDAATNQVRWDDVTGEWSAYPESWNNLIASTTGIEAITVGLRIWTSNIEPVPVFTMGLHFWGPYGADLGVTETVTCLPSNAVWAEATLAGAAIPAGASWLTLDITATSPGGPIEMGAGAIVIFAMPDVEAVTGFTSYTNPRDIQITLQPDRTNLATNPSFENGTVNGWTANTNCTLAPSTVASYDANNNGINGTWSAQVTSVAAGPMKVVSAPFPLAPGGLLTASVYDLFPGSVTGTVTCSVQLFDSTPLVLDAHGNPSNPIRATITGTTTPEYLLVNFEPIFNQWVRPFVQIQPSDPAPSVAAEGRLVLTWNAETAGEIHYFDDVLIETTWSLGTYFDANAAALSPQASDYLWFNPANQTGPSYYYSNRVVKTKRLTSVLLGTGTASLGQGSPFSTTGFLPLGATFTLETEQPVPIVPIGSMVVPNTWGSGRWGISQWTDPTATGTGGWGYAKWGQSRWGDTGAPLTPPASTNTVGSGVEGNLSLPNLLPFATVGQPYTASLPATLGVAPYSYSVILGALPAGFSLNPTNGAIVGTPTVAGNTTFTLQVVDSTLPSPRIAFDTYTLQINAAPSTLTIIVSDVPSAVAGESYSYDVTALGGTPPYTFAAVGTLGSGFTISAAGALYSANVGGVGSQALSIRVTDSLARVATGIITIEINP